MIRIGPGSARIISCDVFDTLLRRNGIAEPNRVRLIADRATVLLAEERGISIDARALWRARMDVQRHAYRALDMVHPTGEVTFAKLMHGMSTALGLGAIEADIFKRAEIAIERTQLAPNRALLAWLLQHAANGIRIIAISDTWHDVPTIMELLDAVAPGHPVAKVYTSADLDATKRSARIFPVIAAEEGMPPSEFLHLGDDELADDLMPRSAGWRAQRIPRSGLVMARRRLDGIRARLQPGALHQ